MSELLTGIASLTKSVQNTLNSYEIRKISDKVQGYMLNYTEAEGKVREATNEDPWGPTGPQMQELAGLTFQYDTYSEVMGMLWKRMLQENKFAWRRVYKSLILLNHLLKNGSERVINSSKDHLFELRALEHYKFIDERGKDEGINVRHRVKIVIELIQDDDMLRLERRKAKTEGRVKYQGFSKDEIKMKVRNTSYDDDWKSDKKFDGASCENKSTINSSKEVSAFDFDSNERGSPELGIREITPEVMDDLTIDDDEFGDFTSARADVNSSTKSKMTTVSNSSALKLHSSPQNFHVTKLPNSSQTTANSLTLPLRTSQQIVQTANQVNAQTQNKQGNIIDIDIGIDLVPDHPDLRQNNDVTSASLFDFNTIPTGQAFNKSITTNNDNLLADDLFGMSDSPINPHIRCAPVLQPHNLSNSVQLDKVTCAAQTQNNQTNQSGFTLPKTWEDLGKVNIDFDKLTLRPTPLKPKPSMNEMRHSTK